MEKQIVLKSSKADDQMLITAMVNLIDKNKIRGQCRTLLDTCSTSNFMTERLATQLKLEKTPYSIPVGALNGMTTYTKHLTTATIKSINGKYQRTLSFLTIPQIAELVPAQSVARESIKIPKNLRLADPTFYKPGPIDMLLGSGPTLSLLCVGQYLLPPDLHMQKTQLGWIVGGSILGDQIQERHQTYCVSTEFNLTKFWEVEEIPKQTYLSPDELAAEQHFITHCTRDSKGRYMVALPFKENQTQLGESRHIAEKRLRGLERKLQLQPALKEQYAAVLNEYLELQHMTKVPNNGEGLYLPHHAVLKESSMTTKIRVVFDGSAKTSTHLSLNDTLLTGPTIQDDIFSLLLRFRFYTYVLTGDIEKMYRQFLVRPQDRKYQQILWRDETGAISTYQLNTVTFGLTAAPFLAIRSLQQLARDYKNQFPIASHILLNDMYVDDLITGFSTEQDAIEAENQIIQCLHQGGLNIRQWASNNARLLQHLPAESVNQRLQLDSDQSLKTLGVHWNSQSDSINYTVKTPLYSNIVTKRTILSQVASLFDPLGLLGPTILLAKNIIQRLWAERVEWDESVPTSIHTLWTDFCTQLPYIDNIQFARQSAIPDAVSIQLHGFCDASEKGYGACIYTRSINKEGQVKTSLLCSKSRVAPLKTISIPRLELCAAHTLAQLYKSVKRAIKISIPQVILWSDSMVALHWIHQSPHQLKTFTANRVSAIQQETSEAEWRHVRSEDNPADALSRGQLPRDLAENKLWKQGPCWLQQPENTWRWQEIQTPKEDSERKGETCLFATAEFNTFKQYSSWTKLIKHVAIWRRFFAWLAKKTPPTGAFTVMELESAQTSIIQSIQKISFRDDLTSLKSAKAAAEYKGKLKNLSPFIDEQGIIRVGGRLERAKVPFNQRHPIILPKGHYITVIIIREEHLKLLHGGVQTTLYSLRSQFWLLDGRNQVRKVIRQCVRCLKARPPIPEYVMGNLPPSRVNVPKRPFTYTGVDYCGPFHIKENKFRNRGKIKIYVAVFICMTTKAIHLEVVTDLSTEGFIAALRRFVSRRGRPQSIQSDNGTNFVGTCNELRTIVKNLQLPKNNHSISSELINKGIEWSFSPPHAPHFGGIWEAAVKCFKHHLVRVVGNETFTLEQFLTLTIEIEAVLNSRPIAPMSSDPNDLAALTPGHFLIGDALTSIPEHDLRATKTNRLSTWQHIQKVRQDFWARWYKEYLNELNVKKKWTSGNHTIQVGSMVLLKEDNLPSLQWRMGRVIEIHPGTDNVTRVISVKTTSGIFKRPIKKVVPLPTVDAEDSTTITT